MFKIECKIAAICSAQKNYSTKAAVWLYQIGYLTYKALFEVLCGKKGGL
jgi:hypothetical protein